uniref:Zinc finger protein 706 n=1 Tax=Hydra vulgaris TaxID=6087 RepID=T2M313_HYDVU
MIYSNKHKKMARGQQKIQSQQKAAERAAKLKKPTSQLKSAGAALIYCCTVCKATMPDPKTYKQHFENKHPKSPLPEEIKGI